MNDKPGKWDRTHDSLKETAIKLFLEKRSANVSMDEIAERADVARRTLFNHFPGKELLVMEITSPVLTDGLDYLGELNKWDSVSLDEVINLFLFLWRRHGRNLNLLYAVDFEDFQELKELHGQYVREYMKVFHRISDWPIELSERKSELAVLFFRIFVNILNSLKDMPDMELRFNKAIKGLLSGIEMKDGL